jgi:hypothetical protein
MSSIRSWRPLERDDIGFLNTLSEILAAAERDDPRAFPLLREAECLFVGSDYGGEHKEASWQTIAFVIADMAAAAAWQPAREAIRRTLLRDGRRMAFKNLNDRVRRQAMQSFLEAANHLPGLIVTFAMPRTLGSLFATVSRPDPACLEFEGLRDLTSGVAEKLLRVVHLIALLVAGFSAPGQDLLWATDEDAIAANPTRLRSLVDTVARVASHLLPHGLRHVRVATAKQDKGDRSLEDLLAIPDIAAGGLSAVLTSMLGARGAPLKGLFLAPSTEAPLKARLVMDWLSDNTQPLRRLVVLVDENPGTRGLRATRLQLHGSRDAFGRL